nr:unnamed protein product [Callosobruchus analis]
MFLSFVRNKADLLETLEANKATSSKFETSRDTRIKTERQFEKLSIEDRLKHVQISKLCINCLNSGYELKKCKFGTCRKCSDRHNSLLHQDTSKSKSTEASQTKTVTLSNQNSMASQTLLSTAMVKINGKHGNTHSCRVLLDSASETNLITKSFCQRLGLSTSKVNISIIGISQIAAHVQEPCDVEIASAYNNFTTTVPSLVITDICDKMPSMDVPVTFWDQEEVDIPRTLSHEEEYFESHFTSNVTRHVDGKFVVSIPFKDSLDLLGDSSESARKRFLNLERKLQKNPDMHLRYSNLTHEYISLDISNCGHVSSGDSPADLADRGVNPSNLLESDLWWNGPKWLQDTSENWPSNKDIHPENLPETKKLSLVSCSLNAENIINFDRFSRQSERRIQNMNSIFTMNTRAKRILALTRQEQTWSYRCDELNPASAVGEPNYAVGEPNSAIGEPDSGAGEPISAVGEPNSAEEMEYDSASYNHEKLNVGEEQEKSTMSYIDEEPNLTDEEENLNSHVNQESNPTTEEEHGNNTDEELASSGTEYIPETTSNSESDDSFPLPIMVEKKKAILCKLKYI